MCNGAGIEVGDLQKHVFNSGNAQAKRMLAEQLQTFGCAGKGLEVRSIRVECKVAAATVVLNYRMPVVYSTRLKYCPEFPAFVIVQLHCPDHKIGYLLLPEPIRWIGKTNRGYITHAFQY